jgi:hypothetical protein
MRRLRRTKPDLERALHIGEIVLPRDLAGRRDLLPSIQAELEARLSLHGGVSDFGGIDLPHPGTSRASADHRVAERVAGAISERVRGGSN